MRGGARWQSILFGLLRPPTWNTLLTTADPSSFSQAFTKINAEPPNVFP